MSVNEFRGFKKIPRWSRDIVVTEKIDGTNGVIYVNMDTDDGGTVKAGSRSRWLYPGKQDNFGFAYWVCKNMIELSELGNGYHYGEWYGQGINRGYGLKEKRFALFNTYRWKDGAEHADPVSGKVIKRPTCCSVVPILYEGPMSDLAVEEALNNLRLNGSKAVAGFQDPEGIVVYHTASTSYFKKTLVDDEKPKGKSEE